MTGPLDLDRLQAAVDQSVLRHEPPRTIYLNRETGPRQRIMSDMAVPLEIGPDPLTAFDLTRSAAARPRPAGRR